MTRPAMQITIGLILLSMLPLLILLALPKAIEADKMEIKRRMEEAVQRQMARDVEWVKKFGNYDINSRRK